MKCNALQCSEVYRSQMIAQEVLCNVQCCSVIFVSCIVLHLTSQRMTKPRLCKLPGATGKIYNCHFNRPGPEMALESGPETRKSQEQGLGLEQ